MNVAVAGASGYTGFELLRVLQFYREVNINQITSRQYAGKTVKEVFPVLIKSKLENLIFSEDLDYSSSDYYFLALPHEASLETVKILLDKGKKVIDLSGAYRIKDISKYPQYYGFEHSYPDLLHKAVYGLPELFREEIKRADLVANPGCYPTSVILALYPAVKEKAVSEETIIVNSLSGISGAGRSLKQQFHYPEGYSDVYPYNITKHRHTPEMEDVLNRVCGLNLKIRFTPHIIPVSRGMLSTITFKTSLSKDRLTEIYRDIYNNEPFVRVIDSPVHIKNVIGSNYCDIYVDKDDRTGFAVVTSAIDNLSKGASTQALQNFNLMIGIEEDRYLKDLTILFP
ncbi:MAG: N-acetyl-gamma-glutamyl-phosphate reductase [Hydrogenothermaceae bacterium]|nr:N-acetyl-gamma-glutamyl-phosphate reductase [Hydrogenothermaceae bacterium]